MATLIVIGSVALVLIVVLSVAMRPQRRSGRAGSPYVEALKLLVAGNKARAFDRLQEAVRSGSAPADAYIKLGTLLRERGELNKALQIHQSLTVKTDLTRDEKTELFLNLAEDYAQMKNVEKAAGVLDSAIRNLEIRDPRVYVRLAAHLHVLGREEKAYDTLREARKLGGLTERELALFLAAAGEAMVRKGDLREARKLLHKSLKHDANCAPALRVLGDLAAEAGEIDEAIRRWKQAALLSPELSGAVLQKIGKTLFDKGRFSEMEQIYDDVRAARWDESATILLARYYKKQGRGDNAIELLEDFLTVHPESVRGALLLASLYAKYRGPEALEAFLDRSIEQTTNTQSAKTESHPIFEFDASSTEKRL